MAIGLIIDKDNESRYKEISKGIKSRKAFSTQKSVHLVAAIISLRLNLTSKSINNKHEIIRYSNLSQKEQNVMKYIALAHTKDPYILLKEEKIIDIVNELANSGFSTLYDTLTETGGDHIYLLIDHCKKYYWDK